MQDGNNKPVDPLPEEARSMVCTRVLSVVCESSVNHDVRPVRVVDDVAPLLRAVIGRSHVERFVVVLLDSKNRPTGVHTVSVGCLTWAVVHPREVYLVAVREQAAAIIVGHNHPSGDSAPSQQDLDITARLVRAGEVLGIPLIDHVIVGSDRCTSLRAAGHIN